MMMHGIANVKTATCVYPEQNNPVENFKFHFFKIYLNIIVILCSVDRASRYNLCK